MKNNGDKNKAQLRLDLEQRKIMLAASLTSVILVVTVLNQYLLSRAENTSSQQQRSIASAVEWAEPEMQAHWQQELAKRFKNSKRKFASIGNFSMGFEEIRGLFEEKYAFQLENGKIKDISFIEGVDGKDRPIYLKDLSPFLERYKDLFHISYDQFEYERDISISDTSLAKKYKLFRDQKLVGYAIFVQDAYSRIFEVQMQDL